MAELRLPRDVLIVRGPDRKTWLDGLLTCAVTEVTPGRAAYGLLLTKQGKIVTDVFLTDDGTQLLLGVAPGQGGVVRELLDRYLVMEDAELDEPAAPLSFGATKGDAPQGVLASGQLNLAGLALTVFVSGNPPDETRGELAALFAQHGLGTFGVDFGERDNPHEASLDRVAVSWTKGCYLGQEVVCMQDMRGKVKRRLVALSGGPELATAASGADVTAADGSVAGHVSSVHPAGGGTTLLASLSAAALQSPEALSVGGSPVRVVEGGAARLS